MALRYDFERAPVPRTALDPATIALLRTERMGLDTRQRYDFLSVFDTVRFEISEGRDPQPLYDQYAADPNGDLAVAAYIEAVASTRRPK